MDIIIFLFFLVKYKCICNIIIFGTKLPNGVGGGGGGGDTAGEVYMYVMRASAQVIPQTNVVCYFR